MKLRTTFLLPAILIAQVICSQPNTVKQQKLTDFDLQSSLLIRAAGSELSNPSYRSPVYWFPVKVPSTVLTGLVANRVYPDPYSGMNNMMIPDASDSFNRQYDLGRYSHIPNVSNPWKDPYWYRTVFTVPASDRGRHFELVFKGINYRAAVWVNGHMVADSARMAGMFAEYSLDVSRWILPGEPNALAVKIYPLDYPGLPAREQLKALDDFYDNGGPTGDIGKNVTMLCSVGWDWIPPVRDRNMGIWQPVFLRTTGQVTINKPRVVADLPLLPDTSEARLTLSLNLVNHANASVKGKLSFVIRPENFTGDPVQFTRDFTLGALSHSSVNLTAKDLNQLIIRQPNLWWPLGYGKANLYRLEVTLTGNDGISDRTSVVFGIRTVSSKTVQTAKDFHRDFYVNGKRVYLVGGAWVPDMMLNTDSTRYDDEIRLCRNANVNLLRIWGGGITPPDVFFDLADRYGLMVWSDFWVTGDTQGEFKGSPDYPLEGRVFIENMTSTIYRIRNHASLLVWTGGNEGHARKELYDAMRDSIIALDGTRPFIPSSSGFARLPAGWKGSWPDNQASGVYSGGPYQWTDPQEYYRLAAKSPDWAFKDETGIPSQPPYNALIKNIPNLVVDPKAPFPMNDSWGYHDAATGNGRYDRYYNDMIKRFGAPVTMEQFSDQMQLMNAMGYQGIFEAAQHRLPYNGGVMLWKLNAAFPSVVWQIYDWYLFPNAGYYFMQRSCDPVHIQLNLNDSVVVLVNRTHRPTGKLTAELAVFNTAGEILFREKQTTEAGSEAVIPVLSMATVLRNVSGVSLVWLKLTDATGLEVSRNSYWLSADRNFTTLHTMKKAIVDMQVVKTKSSDQVRYSVKLTNSSGQPAFFTRLQLMNGKDEITPAFWSGNYMTLLPGETTLVSVSVPRSHPGSDHPAINLSGWNVESQQTVVK
jgi:beta-galactosidase/beta-glucuronidase